jgi:hypothetical protein
MVPHREADAGMIITVSDDESNASSDSPGIFDSPNGSVADNDNGMTVR